MKKILVLECGLKPGWTKKAADKLIDGLSKMGEYEIDRVNLRDEKIEPCRGCGLCLDRGEEKCRNYGDAANMILQKMLLAEGILIVTPNYSLQVPWNLKMLFDRLAFVFHRPRLFGRVFMPVTVQGVYAGQKINKYMNEVMGFWGCRTLKGTVLQGALHPNDVLEQKMLDANEEKISEAVISFTKSLVDNRPQKPSLFQMMIFRMTREAMKSSPYTTEVDKKYYADNGWLESKYYYKVGMGPLLALTGALAENMAKGMQKKENN